MTAEEAYAKFRQKDEYFRVLQNLVTQIKPGQIDCWKEYRAFFDSEDWPQNSNRLLADWPERSNIKSLYAEEGLHDRFLERVMAANDNVRAVLDFRFYITYNNYR